MRVRICRDVPEVALLHAFGMGDDWSGMMPSGSRRGVEHFKRSFGARHAAVLVFESVATLGRLLRGTRARLASGS